MPVNSAKATSAIIRVLVPAPGKNGDASTEASMSRQEVNFRRARTTPIFCARNRHSASNLFGATMSDPKCAAVARRSGNQLQGRARVVASPPTGNP